MKIQGSLALVTGAGSGIGRATARRLARAGARIVATDVDDARLRALEHELGGALFLRRTCDVSKDDDVRALVAALDDQGAELDVLVNNAGVGLEGGLLGSRDEDLRWVFEVNFWGTLRHLRAFVPGMVARRRGHVVNLASMFGLVAPQDVLGYAATKFAVVGLTESLRSELAPHGVGVSAICPGMIATNIVADGRFARETDRDGAVSLFARRGASPDTVAKAVVSAIEKNRALVPVRPESWAAWLGKRLAPEATARAMSVLQGRLASL